MLRLINIIILTLLFFIPMIATAESNTDETVKKIIIPFKEKHHIPGITVQLYLNGKPHSYYFGYADQNKNNLVNKNTIFEIGSISKIITNLLFAQEIDAANIHLNDSVTKYLPELPQSFEKITLLNLATHTSGLPFEAPDNINSRLQLENYLNSWLPQSSPNEQLIYSNIGVGLLGFILERINHTSAKQLYTAKIFKPLKMQPILFIVPARLKEKLAQGYDQNNKPIAPEKLDLFPAAWFMKASGIDMQYFLKAAIGLQGPPNRILNAMRITQTAYFKLDNYDQGLGWQIYLIDNKNLADLLEKPMDILKPTNVQKMYIKPIFNGNNLIEKTGLTQGFCSYIGLIPNKKTGIVILTNHHLSDKTIATIGRKILFKANGMLKSENE